MNLELGGKRVVVAGASRGIGRTIAESFAAEGARVLAVARGAAGLDDLAATLGCSTAPLDLTEAESVAALRAAVTEKLGGLDVLICNVGSGRSVPPGEESAEEWHRVLGLNLFAAIHALDAVRPLLQAGGAVVCISSITGRRVLGAPVAYSAAKAAVDELVVNSARPLAAKGVRIVGVAPGNVVFPGSVWEKKLTEDRSGVDAMLARDVPMGRLGTPQEIADLVLFLASARASFITGTVVVADGGQAGLA